MQSETTHGQILELQKKVDDSSELINILEYKLEKAESETLRAFDEKKHKVDIPKNSIKKGDHKVRNLQKNLEDTRKIVKDKEKTSKS